MTVGPDKSAAELVGEFVALVAGVVREDEYRRAESNAARRRAGRALSAHDADAAARRARAAVLREAARRHPMLPVAACLARAAAMGDQAGVDVLLSRPRSLPEWRQLTAILAAAADPGRITVPGQAA